MAKKWLLLVVALILLGIYALFLDEGQRDALLGDDSSGLPDPYYLELRPADVQNPDEVIRYFSSIKSYAEDLDAFERAAFYEWYFKSHGFDVSFAYAEDFGGRGMAHLWLLVKNKKGEVIEVDPSFSEVKGQSMMPLDPEYTVYDEEFEDIFDAADALGPDRMAWWKDEKACGILNENVLL